LAIHGTAVHAGTKPEPNDNSKGRPRDYYEYERQQIHHHPILANKVSVRQDMNAVPRCAAGTVKRLLNSAMLRSERPLADGPANPGGPALPAASASGASGAR